MVCILLSATPNLICALPAHFDVLSLAPPVTSLVHRRVWHLAQALDVMETTLLVGCAARSTPGRGAPRRARFAQCFEVVPSLPRELAPLPTLSIRLLTCAGRR